MEKRMLFISPMFPKSKEENHIVPFVNQFTSYFANQTDVKVDVITFFFPKSQHYVYNDTIDVYPIGSGFKRYFYLLPYLVKGVFMGIRLCKKNNYNGILCFWHRESSVLGKLLARLFNIKLRVWLQGQDAQPTNKYANYIKLSSEELIMLSDRQMKHFNKHHRVQAQKIANVAIDRNNFPDLNTSNRQIDVLGVGNLSNLKNYSLFLMAVHLVKKNINNINVVICGADRGEKSTLKKQIKDLNLTENIVFAGSVSHQKVLHNMNNAKVFLHTSKYEGGGIVLHEALYSGCYVISTIPIEDGETLENFYFSTDTDKLAEKLLSILTLYTHTAKRVEKFNMEDTVQNIFNEFYD